MKTTRYFLFFLCCLFVFSCQNAENTSTSLNSSDSLSQAKVDIKGQTPSFVFKYNPNKEMSDEEVMNALADRYVSESGNNGACDCAEKTCYAQKLLLKHYFKQNNKICALAVVGNNCSSDDAPRANAGWCDMALFEQQENGDWTVQNFWQEVGGGADWGQSGDAGDPIQVADEGIAIPIGAGSMGQGYSFEIVDFIAYVDGEAKNVGKLQVHMDNAGNAFDDDDLECTCTSYEFKPNATTSYYDLHLTSKDCKNASADQACDGEILKETVVEMDKDGYNIPKDFNMW